MEYSIAPQILMKINKESKIRFGIFLLTVIAFCFLEFFKIQSYCNEVNYRFSVIEYVYLITASGANLPYTSIVFLLLLENSYQSQLCVSTNKMIEQVLKSIRAGLFASLCIVFFSMIPAFVAGTWHIGWTEPLLMSEGKLTNSIISRVIYTNVSPIGGLLLGAIVLAAFWTSVGCVLIACKEYGLYHLGVALLLYFLFWGSIYLPSHNNICPNWFFSLNAIVNQTSVNTFYADLLKAIALNLGVIIISVICNAAREHYCHINLKKKG